jgi:hypothetical protein
MHDIRGGESTTEGLGLLWGGAAMPPLVAQLSLMCYGCPEGKAIATNSILDTCWGGSELGRGW